jgi:hypothetical protein
MEQIHHRHDVRPLARELAVAVHVARGVFAAEQAVDFGQALAQAFEFVEDAFFHGGVRGPAAVSRRR